MTAIQMSSELKATLVQCNATDDFAIHMARVSAAKQFGELPPIPESTDKARFIRALMLPRHGVPFEHNIFTFFMEMPIFVARQQVKHRISSMNEMSGRYTQLLPKFYMPDVVRPVVNVGTKMKPKFEADYFKLKAAQGLLTSEAASAWRAYQMMLADGIAEEVARMVLPVNVYTQFYWSVNARSLMTYLERRVDHPANRVETHPQYEIDVIGGQVERAFASAMPLTHQAFVEAGRVAP